MTRTVGGNINTNSVAVVTTYTLNSVTATKIGDAVDSTKRIYFAVALEPGLTDVDVLIRLYPAAVDNIPRGIPLVRDTFGNSSLFYPMWEMDTFSVYLGEISAMTTNGTIDVYVTEF